MVVEVVEEEKGVKTSQMVWQMEENLFVDVDNNLFLLSCGLLVEGYCQVHQNKLLQRLCYDFDRFSLYRRDRIQSVSDNAQASVQGAS